MESTLALKESLAQTTSLLLAVMSHDTLAKKIECLERFVERVEGKSKEEQYALMAARAVGQDVGVKDIETLLALEEFYASSGGIIGYWRRVYEALLERGSRPSEETLLPPQGMDITRESRHVKEAYVKGIQELGSLAEVYPVGGAADRLQLQDSKTQEALPAAKLLFGGRELLEGLFRDVAGREYVHYKLYGKQVSVPIVMMTSMAKRGAMHVSRLCEKNGWFGRDPENILMMCQPLVPVVDRGGQWLGSKTKPGGHGAIWPLLLSKGFFVARREGSANSFAAAD